MEKTKIYMALMWWMTIKVNTSYHSLEESWETLVKEQSKDQTTIPTQLRRQGTFFCHNASFNSMLFHFLTMHA